jgi:hypothetical protein
MVSMTDLLNSDSSVIPPIGVLHLKEGEPIRVAQFLMGREQVEDLRPVPRGHPGQKYFTSRQHSNQSQAVDCSTRAL